jgi:hypothetical protein
MTGFNCSEETEDFWRSNLIKRMLRRYLKDECKCDILCWQCFRCETLDKAERLFPEEFAESAIFVAKNAKEIGSRAIVQKPND